jgi:ABC-type phosphate/phosphonate transport system substrate-binding protein
MNPIAALQAYDDEPVRWANDMLWQALRRRLTSRGVAAPEKLWRGGSYSEPWASPGLILSQTCGYPYATRLRGKVALIATPIYSVEGCDGPRYSSAIVIRVTDAATALTDLRGKTAAFNSRDSQSGWNAFRAAIAPLAQHGRFFGRAIETGSHHASLAAVIEGKADVCCADCVTWALFRRNHPGRAARLRVIAWSPPAPGLPLIASASLPAAMIDAIRAGVIDVSSSAETQEARDALFIAGAEVLPASAYEEIAAMDRESRRLGYADLM